jgi:hypothetical protein
VLPGTVLIFKYLSFPATLVVELPAERVAALTHALLAARESTKHVCPAGQSAEAGAWRRAVDADARAIGRGAADAAAAGLAGSEGRVGLAGAAGDDARRGQTLAGGALFPIHG